MPREQEVIEHYYGIAKIQNHQFEEVSSGKRWDNLNFNKNNNYGGEIIKLVSREDTPGTK